MNELDITQLNMAAFKDKVLVGDGHTLFMPDHYEDVGFPEGFVPVETHVSGDHPKEMIFVDGQLVESLEGVYHLDLLNKVVGALGLKFPRAMGRGFQADQCVDAINEYLEAQNGGDPLPTEGEGGDTPHPEVHPETTEDEHD